MSLFDLFDNSLFKRIEDILHLNKTFQKLSMNLDKIYALNLTHQFI